MKQMVSLSLIAVASGIVLMGLLKVVQILIGSQAYVLLFNTDYIPVLPDWGPEDIGGISFHFVFCIVSVAGLFYVLKLFRLERSILAYFLIYTVGSAVLYSLTGLTDRPPAINDIPAWAYWTSAHVLYGFIVGWFVKKWI